jgi:hypothetical protein
MGRDLISTHKAIPLFSVNQTGSVGLQRGNEADLRAAMAGAHDLREDVTNMMLMIDVDVGNAGTVDIVIQHRTTQSVAFTNYVSLTQITADGLYIAEVNRLRRYVQAAVTIAGNTVVLSINAVGNRARRAPVRQTGTELTVTQNSNP